MIWPFKTRPEPARRSGARLRPSVIEVEHGGATYQVSLKRIANARRLTLRVRTARRDVVLSMPANGSFAAAQRFATSHAAWIADKIGNLASALPLVPGCEILLRGRIYRAVHEPRLRHTVRVDDTMDPPSLCVGGSTGQFGATLVSFLKDEAREDLTRAVARHAATTGARVRSLTLRDTRSRWGSCSARGALNFSWRLIMAPPLVLDYLAAHETAHLIHLNHSDSFWTLVHHLCPRMDEAESWLKRHGASLHRYGHASGSGARPTTGGTPGAKT